MIGKINTKGFNINGIIEQYTAGTSSISAGDFVSYINGWGVKTDTQLTTVNITSYYKPSAVALSDSKVFIARGKESYYLSGIISTPLSTIETTNSTSGGVLGVAQTSAAAGETVNVYVPNV